MISGHVDKDLQARVPLSVVSEDGNITTLNAVVDTGFNGQVCVSIFEIKKIKLTFAHVEKFELGNGKIVDQDVFLGEIIFDKQALLANILVSSSEDTLIGASLLAGKKLEIDYSRQTVRVRSTRKNRN